MLVLVETLLGKFLNLADSPVTLLDRGDTILGVASDLSSPLAQTLLIMGTVPGSAVHGTANTAMYYPIIVKRPFKVLKYCWINGATVAGNVNMCITDSVGTVVTNSVVGSTVQAGISALQVSAALGTPPVLRPGNYMLAFVTSDATATFWRFGPTSQMMRVSGCQQMAANFALGNATFANPSVNHVCSCAAVGALVI